MKNLFTSFIFIAFSISKLCGQTPESASVEIEALVQASPPKITLSWTAVAGSIQYQIFRKSQSATVWGSPIATLEGSALAFEDNEVNRNILYEYKIIRDYGAPYAGYGYITSGIEMEPVGNRGIIILVIDNTFTTSLSAQIKILTLDLEGEGWMVKKVSVNPAASVASVKALIKSRYTNNPLKTKAVLLIGHVPVPYSGDIAPDGHPDHLGSWSSDHYYADMDGVWTDNVVNRPDAPNFRNVNVPGDGKFDQSTIPFDAGQTNDNLELQIGRVDMFDLPLFSNATELQLLKNYFDRNHQYRTKVIQYENKGLIDDNFGYFYGEAFAVSGWRNFSPLVGSANVFETDYFTTLANDSYLWSYGCGPGSWYGIDGDNMVGVGTTLNMATTNIKTVFTMLFGSYLGDWDHTNSVMKGSLASGALACAWAGRPAWMFHDMGMDGTLGYSSMLSQNNNSQLYSTTYIGAGLVHAVLLGDPTLRNKVISPPRNFMSSFTADGINLSWTASTEPGIAGYNIYSINSGSKTYSKINSQIITGTNFNYCSQLQSNTYYLRAVKLVTTPSGSFYLESTGIKKKVNAAINLNYQLATVDKQVTIVNNSTTQNPNYNYLWEYSDETVDLQYNPTPKIFADYGLQSVTLNVYNGCTNDSYTQTFTLTPPTPPFLEFNDNETSNQSKNRFTIAPNPSNSGVFNIVCSNNTENYIYSIQDELGKVISNGNFDTSKNKSVDLSSYSSGIYFIRITGSSANQVAYKLIKQ